MVNALIRNVAVSGFKISGFPASGIFFLGVDNSAIKRNVTTDDGEYGIARFSSSGGKIVANKASGADEAGIYVGDSPHADVLVAANEAADNGAFGFFFRDAAHGSVVGNRAHGNCVGAGVLNTGANVAADWRFTGNTVTANTRFCPANEEEGEGGKLGDRNSDRRCGRQQDFRQCHPRQPALGSGGHRGRRRCGRHPHTGREPSVLATS